MKYSIQRRRKRSTSSIKFHFIGFCFLRFASFTHFLRCKAYHSLNAIERSCAYFSIIFFCWCCSSLLFNRLTKQQSSIICHQHSFSLHFVLVFHSNFILFHFPSAFISFWSSLSSEWREKFSIKAIEWEKIVQTKNHHPIKIRWISWTF